ncbi:MAG: hypothetical protein ACTSXQ_01990 [Alphaproteobacteria bacterium]
MKIMSFIILLCWMFVGAITAEAQVVDLSGSSSTVVNSPSFQNTTPAGWAPGSPIFETPPAPQPSPAPIADPDYRGVWGR